LAAAKNSRKVILTVGNIEAGRIPAGIQARQTDRAGLERAMIELRNQYRLEFESPGASLGEVQVILIQPPHLPRLEVSWK